MKKGERMLKDKTNFFITYFFWVLIIVCTFVDCNRVINEYAVELGMISQEYLPNISNGIKNALLVLICFLYQFIKFFPLTIGYIAYKVTKKKHNKERMDKIDWKNDSYYREIIPKYSVAVLSYIDNFELEFNDIGAALLSLELKGKIKIDDDKFEVLNHDTAELSKNEKYLLSCLETTQRPVVEFRKFKQAVIADTQDSELVEKKMNIGKKLVKTILSLIGATILMFILVTIVGVTMDFEALEASNEIPIQVFVIIAIVAIFMFVVPAYLRTSFFMHIGFKMKDPFVRSKEGSLLNEKLEGLRKYIEDYSNLEDKEKEALTLWEEYLIYSMLFGINKKASENIINKVTIV